MASLREIAAAVGVSIRTVNRALKQEGYVREETRKQILETAQRLGYRPNLAARALKTGQSLEVGVLVGSLDELHMAKLAAFERLLRAVGFAVHVFFGPRDDSNNAQADKILHELTARRPAAAALFPNSHVPISQAVAQFDRRGIPYVVIDPTGANADHVAINRQQGVYEAVKFLASKGKRNIAYLGYTTDRSGDYVGGQTRLEGYERAIRELGLPERVLAVAPHVDEFAGGRDSIDMFLATKPRPDAIQAYTDVMAAGFLTSLHDEAIRVPQEVAVVGFDDRRIAELCWPRLTTVSQANTEIGEAAARVLLDKLSGKACPPEGWSRRLSAPLVVREST